MSATGITCICWSYAALNVDRAPQVQADFSATCGMLACVPCVQQYLPLWMVAPLL